MTTRNVFYTRLTDRRAVNYSLSETQLIVHYKSLKMFYRLCMLARNSCGFITDLDYSQNLVVLSFNQSIIEELSDYEKLLAPSRLFPLLIDAQGQSKVVYPDCISLEFDELVDDQLLLSLTPHGAKLDRISSTMAIVTLPAGTTAFNQLNLISKSCPHWLRVAEPVFITFMPANTASDYLIFKHWGALTYHQKTRTSEVYFTPVPEEFTVTYSDLSGESPVATLEKEGLEVLRVDPSENMAVIRPKALRGISSISDVNSAVALGAELSKFFGLADDDNSIIRATFPVLKNQSDELSYLRPLECLVEFHRIIDGSPVTHQDILIVLEENGFSIREEIYPFGFLCIHSSPEEYFEGLRSLAHSNLVLLAEPVFLTFRPNETVIPDDPEYSLQWNLKSIDAEGGWPLELGNPNVVIVVADQGVDLNHNDLQSVFVPRSDEDWNYVDESLKSPSELVSQHGTLISGIICSQHNMLGIAGLAPGCSLLPIKLYGLSLKTTTLKQALLYINNYATANPDKIFVVNMSFGVSDSESVEMEVKRGEEIGVIYVASAGNEARDKPHYPSDYEYVLSVAALGPDHVFASSYSNFGAKVDLCAPGGLGLPRAAAHNILSLNSRDRTGYDFGTSMAAPHVSAAAALLCARAKRLNVNLIPRKIRSILKETADNIDAINPNYTGLMGGGALNVRAALKRLETE